MSIVYTELTFKNVIDEVFAEKGYAKEDEIRQAIVDTGAWTLVINNETREKLGPRDTGVGEAAFADGQSGEYPMAGPMEVWWKKPPLGL
jgi:predicted aspartyl protease